MPKVTKRSEKYSHGTICATRDGKAFNASLYLAGGERRRRRFKTKTAAQLWLDSQSSEYRPLSQAQMLDASRAFALLPENITLLDTAKFYLASRTAATPLPFDDAAERFVKSRSATLRSVTLRWYENALISFGAGITDVQTVGELDRSRIERELEARTPSVRNALLRVLSAFFSWAVKSGYAVANPIDGIEKSKVARPKRSVLDIERTVAILAMCEYSLPSAIPYVTVGLFAGIRPNEILKLRRDDLKNGYIYLGPDVAKTSSERTVPIRDNLAAWLDKYPISDGVFSGASITLTRTLRRLFGAVGIGDRKDIFRHSYASYAYELTGDAAKVAAELGHTDTSMLFRHYRGLVPPGSGKRFFSITPETVAQNLPKHRTQTAQKRT